jgi:ATP-dependent Clp protease, protease subunit
MGASSCPAEPGGGQHATTSITSNSVIVGGSDGVTRMSGAAGHGAECGGTGQKYPQSQEAPEMRMNGMAAMTMSDSVYERLLQQRIIVLGQQVDDEIANRIVAQLLLLFAEDPEAEIRLYINSPGGSVMAGMAIYDTMQYIECDVATYAMGLAASMGQFLLTAGERGKRYALPHAQILMHQPSAGVGGTESDIAIQAEQFRRHKRVMAELTAEQTGQTVEKITADADRDRWFTAQEALEYGFIDHVVSRVTQEPGKQ